jgi:NAD(P)-dependent dehydrogenase (short-subunit alcohol dehydrogenase family)
MVELKEGLGLDGKTAIVAGGGAKGDGIGNGRAAAILFARAGVRVFVVDRDLALAQRTVEMIEAEGGEAAAHAADLTDETACEAMIAAAMTRFGRLDFLDNNVGIGSAATVVEESREKWEQVMQVNVEVMFLTSKYAIPAMIESGNGGAIVNISSISALRPRGLTAYTTSKGAVIALTGAMAVDHATDGIRVNCVAPGPVYTPMVNRGGTMSDASRDGRRKSSLLEVEGTGWDIGNAVVFLCSDWARYITGQTLVVDGGVTLTARARGHGSEG